MTNETNNTNAAVGTTEVIKKIDAVFEGGGVKGIALVGAVMETVARGYAFENVAGTSAGAIVAALVAAGYTPEEMKVIMSTLDYNKFQDPTFLTRIPLVGGVMSLLINKGMYAGDYFETWMRDLLAKKNVHTFKDLILDEYATDPKYRYKLQVIASDITHGTMLVLPRDSAVCGVASDDLDVAKAVRMSMSIPYFFTPVVPTVKGAKSYVVDGGLLSNFPVWLLDSDEPAKYWPTIGYKLVAPDANKPHTIYGPLTLFKALFDTTMEAHDARYIEDANFVRTVPIPTLGVHTTEFDISDERKEALLTSGKETAAAFFDKWNFESFKAKYVTAEGVQAGTRTESAWK